MHKNYSHNNIHINVMYLMSNEFWSHLNMWQTLHNDLMWNVLLLMYHMLLSMLLLNWFFIVFSHRGYCYNTGDCWCHCWLRKKRRGKILRILLHLEMLYILCYIFVHDCEMLRNNILHLWYPVNKFYSFPASFYGTFHWYSWWVWP